MVFLGLPTAAGEYHEYPSCMRRDQCFVICRSPISDVVLFPARNLINISTGEYGCAGTTTILITGGDSFKAPPSGE
jgi:hypothetical protein